MTTRYVSLLGLGFGDCGKGLFTDHLCHALRAHTVVRFNGGAQAGHNVVLADGRHHTFSQFGAGTFQPGVTTLLASPVVVHTTALVLEARHLREFGVGDPLARLTIDARCLVTTPFHQAAGRLREAARGEQAHGSCGVGVGETVRHALACPALALRYGDLLEPKSARAKLELTRLALRQAVAALPGTAAHTSSRPGALSTEQAVLEDTDMAERWLAASSPCLEASPPAGVDRIGERLGRAGTVVFEGAQGVLLDEWRGFHPHTTWSTISTRAVEAVLVDAGIGAQVEHLGVLRSYLTRHGAGPLPTHDARLDALVALRERHNADGGWQGSFRRGHVDAVLLRYALAAVGPLDGLVASHLDLPWRDVGLRWCDAYRCPDAFNASVDIAGIGIEPGQRLDRLPLSTRVDLDHQRALTTLLGQVVPAFAAEPIESADDWRERIEACSGLPLRWGGFGPTRETVAALRA